MDAAMFVNERNFAIESSGYHKQYDFLGGLIQN